MASRACPVRRKFVEGVPEDDLVFTNLRKAFASFASQESYYEFRRVEVRVIGTGKLVRGLVSEALSNQELAR